MSYEPAEATTPITVGKNPTKLVMKAIVGPIRAGVPFIVGGILLSDSVGLMGKRIYIYYDSIQVASPFTGDFGEFSAEMTIPTEGMHTLTFEFYGDAIYLETSFTSPAFEVLPAIIPTILTIKAPSSVFVDQVFSVTGVLARADTGAGLSGQIINVSWNSEIIGSVTTYADGTYEVSGSIPVTGTFTLTAEFTGTATMSAATAALGVRIGAALIHTVKVEAFTWPLPPGSVKADVIINTAVHKTPFEMEVPEGSVIIKATYNEQTLEETVTVDADLTVLLLFDPAGVLSRVLVVPTEVLPPLPSAPSLPAM